jgi:hypothetical protein
VRALEDRWDVEAVAQQHDRIPETAGPDLLLDDGPHGALARAEHEDVGNPPAELLDRLDQIEVALPG